MKEFLLRNPWARSFIPLFLMAIASLCTNSLVVEITNESTIQWSQIPKTFSFYIIIISTTILCIYQVFIFKNDNNASKGITAKQYDATIRNKVADKVAERSVKLINQGLIEQLEKETSIFKQLYGEGVQ